MNKKVRIGKTDLYVNPIGLGTNAVGGHNLYPNLNEEVGKQLVRTALNHGINFLDTAFIYGPKRSEELIGEVLKENGNREAIVIATKGAHKINDGQVVIDNSPEYLRKTVEDSLKRLQTDYIDLFYIHYPDKVTPKDEAVGELRKLKEEGKIRAIGVSNFSIDELKEANKDGYVDVFQGEYNLLNRSAEEIYFPYMVEHEISFVPYYPLASGLLTGKFNQTSTFNDLRSRLKYFQEGVFEENLQKVEKLKTICEEQHVEMTHLVLAWYLTRDAIDVIIPGAKNEDQVINNLKTLEVNLRKEDIDRIDLLFK